MMILEHRRATMRTTRTLYVNTWGIDTELNQYLEYCQEFADLNKLEMETYESANSWAPDCDDDAVDGEYYDCDGNTKSCLALWDDYCNGKEIANYMLD